MKRAGKCVNKKAYALRSKALEAAKRSYVQRQVKTDIYECPMCLDFHLTSKPYNGFLLKKYFKKWDRQWMHNTYNDYLVLERQVMMRLQADQVKTKRQLKRARLKANKLARQSLLPDKPKVAKRKQNTLSIKEQKAFFASFDSKIYPQPKSFWSRILGIISNGGEK